jgi:hypothetical protein
MLSPLPLRAEWILSDGARAHPAFHGPVPKKSDIVFSTRYKRPEALDAIRAFGATRVEWCYSNDKDYIRVLKTQVGSFGGTLNSIPPLSSDDGTARDFDGKPLIHPRMKATGWKWVTTTHPDTEKTIQAQATKFLDAGADSIQIDDPLLQVYSAYNWGGDFNASTLAGFSKYLDSYPDQEEVRLAGLDQLGHTTYREYLITHFNVTNAHDYLARYRSFPSNALWEKYLRATVREHYRRLRQHLDTVRGRHVPLSMNLAFTNQPDEGSWDFYLGEIADYVIAETSIGNPNAIVVQSATLRAMGLGHVPSIRPRTIVENQLAIAMFYALGAQPLVPWDIYISMDDTGNAKRFFGSPDDYAHLYSLVRKHPELFDQKELAAVVGILIPVDKFKREETVRLSVRLMKHQVPFAFVLVGGNEKKYLLDPARANRYKMLITANPDGDFTEADQRTLRALQVQRTHANGVTDDDLRTLSPFNLDAMSSKIRLYPRAGTSGELRDLVIHVVDERYAGKQGGDAACQSSVRMKKSMIGAGKIDSVTWISPSHTLQTDWREAQNDVVLSVPECSLWGILAIRFE